MFHQKRLSWLDYIALHKFSPERRTLTGLSVLVGDLPVRIFPGGFNSLDYESIGGVTSLFNCDIIDENTAAVAAEYTNYYRNLFKITSI